LSSIPKLSREGNALSILEPNHIFGDKHNQLGINSNMNGVIKGYVLNRAYLDGSIAKGFLT
jgi:hypothetical protein